MTIKDLGFNYEYIDACPNDYVLFRKECDNEVRCPKCDSSKYKKRSIKILEEKFPVRLLYLQFQQRFWGTFL